MGFLAKMSSHNWWFRMLTGSDDSSQYIYKNTILILYKVRLNIQMFLCIQGFNQNEVEIKYLMPISLHF